MVPDVTQVLAAVRHQLAKTVLPAIPAEEGFAQEQAGLVLASLDWLVEVQRHEADYTLVERADLEALLSELLELGGGDAEAEQALADAAETPPDVTTARAQSTSLRAAATRVHAAALEDAERAERARALWDHAATRQLEREAAWFRMTGFPVGADQPIDVVLARQRTA